MTYFVFTSCTNKPVVYNALTQLMLMNDKAMWRGGSRGLGLPYSPADICKCCERKQQHREKCRMWLMWDYPRVQQSRGRLGLPCPEVLFIKEKMYHFWCILHVSWMTWLCMLTTFLWECPPKENPWRRAELWGVAGVVGLQGRRSISFLHAVISKR